MNYQVFAGCAKEHKNLMMRFDILNECSPKELGISKGAKKYSLGIKEIIITTTSLNPEFIIQD